MIEIRPASGPIQAIVRLPGSKSYTNRALMVAALATGESVLRGALFCDDTRYMLTALGDLGFGLVADEAGETIRINGRGGTVPAREASLYCGNAGTAVRFLTALVSLGDGRYRIDGSPRMRERPLQPLLDALGQLGVEAVSLHGNGCPPILVTSRGCRGGAASMEGALSSQFFSALAMAGPAMPEGLELTVVGELASKPYLDMTADLMAAFGARLENEGYRRFRVAPGSRYVGCEYDIEPDASAASYFFAAAAVTGGRVTVPGLRRSSRQGDVGFVGILEQMGCRASESEHGLTVEGPAQLRGVSVDMNAMSDVAMTLAAIAPFADSPVEIRNIAFIRRKESDRIAAMATELGRLGVAVTEYPDGWRIEPSRPHGGSVETYDDHRLAMSFSVLGLRVPGVTILDPECVSKTFPNFFVRFGALTAGGLA